MNPFRFLARVLLLPAIRRWRLGAPPEIPVERPPRAKSPRRLHVVWSGSQMYPYPLTIEEPTTGEERWR